MCILKIDDHLNILCTFNIIKPEFGYIISVIQYLHKLEAYIYNNINNNNNKLELIKSCIKFENFDMNEKSIIDVYEHIKSIIILTKVNALYIYILYILFMYIYIHFIFIWVYICMYIYIYIYCIYIIFMNVWYIYIIYILHTYIIHVSIYIAYIYE